MGYAQMQQKGKGIHTRQYSRAFIIEDGDKRVVFVTVDAGMMGHTVKRNVIRELTKKYGNLYTHDNMIISGTHTHSTPGGFLTYLLYDMTCLGFVSETFNAFVKGITQSVVRAHNNMREGRIFLSQIDVDGANINRSPVAYDNNPEEEKKM
jgi:neutral ceramidase